MRNGVVNVLFTKADGTQRELPGTLDITMIPEDKRPKGIVGHSQGELDCELIKCYDVEKDSWRSFKTSTVISYEAVDQILI